ncbi:hypothetical protein KHQ81_10205 [Mycoplasmatota bacterium]|nr:hypothetical protein KHQ81_10205 [Mycoplasmatota bacterium]
MILNYIFLFISLYILILYFPWYITFYTEGKVKCYLIMFGFIRVPISLQRFIHTATTRKTQEEKDVNIMEIFENYKKMLSIRPIYHDLLERSTIKHLYWYSAVPMENPLLGLSLLPIYTTMQQVFIDYINEHFKKVSDIDVETKFNYIDNDVFIYFDCIIKTNLAKIISVSVKYITKIPLVLKRTQ